MIPFVSGTTGQDDQDRRDGDQAAAQPQLVQSRRRSRRRSRYRSRNRTTIRRRRRMGSRQSRTTSHESSLSEFADELDRRRTLLTSFIVNARMHSLDHVIRVVEGVYLLLENGYSPVRNPDVSQTAELYLQANMSHDVEWTNLIGVESFLRQYRQYSEAHASVRSSISSIMQIDEPPTADGCFTLTSRSVLRFRINRDTLARFFPSALQDEFLVQQLIGLEYTVEYSKVFDFRNGLIISHKPFVEVAGQSRLLPTSGSFEQHVRRSLASTRNALRLLEQ